MTPPLKKPPVLVHDCPPTATAGARAVIGTIDDLPC